MAKNNKLKINLPSLDDLFSTDKSREEDKREKVYDILLTEIDDFPNHPFKVIQDDAMFKLTESIRIYGVMTPVMVRKKENGRYELISGHRRKKACELVEIKTIPAVIRNLTHDEAVIMMVDANLQREVVLPSEKAFSYKMRLEAMKRQSGRPSSNNYSSLANNLINKTSSTELAESLGTSKDQIFRYIRLTELIPELLQMVDDKQIGFRPAVEISYILKEEQYTLSKIIQSEVFIPSLSQATKMKLFSQEGRLNKELIFSIINEGKPNQKEKVVLKDERFKKYFPKNYNIKQKEDLLISLLEKWYQQEHI